MSNRDIAREFFLGNHAKVAEKLLSSRSLPTSKTLPFLVGSLSFLGRIEEAEQIYRENEQKIQGKEKAACRFYLAVGFCRQSFYEKGRGYFFFNLVEFRKSSDSDIQFYLFQGVGFYRYLQCRYQLGARWALRSLISANRSRFLYGRYLASDLLGYTLVLSGKISEGLRALDGSKKLALTLGTGSWHQAAEVAILCFEAQFGLKPKTILRELDKLFARLSSDLSYLQSSLLLEKSRQLTLRGNITKSDKTLNEAFRLIYESKHKRHGVLLNLRFAENRFLQNEYYNALNLVRNSKSDLNVNIDRQLFLSTIGMEKKICAALGLPVEQTEIESVTQRYGSSAAKAIWRRESGQNCLLPTEDRISSLLDQCAQGPLESTERILESGYFSLLKARLPISVSKKQIFPDLSPRWIVINENGNLRVVSKVQSSQMDLLLRFLCHEEIPKGKLVKKIWGYEYHPLRHDPLLYRAIGRLKEYLDFRTTWIEASPHGYRLSPEVSITLVKARTSDFSVTQPPVSANREANKVLNYRQTKILQALRKKDFLGVKEVENLFGISNMTACRDLAGLVQRGELQRVGRARATRYCLFGGTSVS